MTTALIGKQGVSARQARVAIISKAGIPGLMERLQRAGHETEAADAFSSLADSERRDVRYDLVFCDQDALADAAPPMESPVVLVCEGRQLTNRQLFGSLSPAAIEDALDLLLHLAVELRQSVDRAAELERIAGGIHSGAALVGCSPLARRLQGVISRAADSEATMLIEGPQGAGKSLVARIVHCKSRRSTRALELADCGQLDGDGMTAALQGARATTLVLENVDRLPPNAQSVLVRHLKERSAQRGETQPRLIATTSAHLPELVARGAFREDLYYRLHAFPMLVPALRERVEDIQPIAEHVLLLASATQGQAVRGFTAAAVTQLESMPWPGNVAQLEAVVRRALLQARGGIIDREHLLASLVPAAAVTTNSAAAPTARQQQEEDVLTEGDIRPFEEEEQVLLSRALRATKGNVRRAAQLLGIGRATLYRKIQQYRLRLQ